MFAVGSDLRCNGFAESECVDVRCKLTVGQFILSAVLAVVINFE
jgi:hypothetical protein